MIFGNSNLLDDFFNDRLTPTWKQVYSKYKNIPMVTRTDGKLEIEMPLPGYEKEDISIDIEDDILIITSDGNDSNSFAKEFTRTFELADDLDQSTCSANMKAGILKITFNENIEKVSKKINVKIS